MKVPFAVVPSLLSRPHEGKAPANPEPPSPAAQTKSGWSAPSILTRPRQEFDDVTDKPKDGALLGSNQTVYDGTTPLSSIVGVRPNNGVPVKARAVFVNGIMTDARMNRRNLQALANSGLEVVGIHNATNGLVHDLVQCIGDKLDLTRTSNRAIVTSATVIEGLLRTGNQDKVILIGHSQGALILSSAIAEVAGRLKAKGLTSAQITAQLGRLEIETLGGAAWTFPDGPKLRHVVNNFDPIALLTGAGVETSALNRSIIRVGTFGDLVDLPPLQQLSLLLARSMDRTVHGLSDVYVNARRK